ncbi:fungal-specific transcription factor domain-containing protein [Halteromyces radiatus]|uniref:fungal-specific transcription factor domain-containing protein n=1 Tax=Halteromyces radiatus TaxID=101107 RepID=UPI00222086E1|nr:fungal-specific transcription factor domain-containing protein [Halteromyces radiatus]KAI8096487.1 fungal-specific transcription factor domain-containing protein [Halteromyces radiatus]
MAVSSSKKQLVKSNDPSIDRKPKRFKVGRACYSCRVKKIKCDGIQPCMQCKARQLSCTFSSDGAMDDDDMIINNDTPNQEDHLDNGQEMEKSLISTTMTATTSKTTTTITTTMNRQSSIQRQQLENTNKSLDYLGTRWPGEGNEGKWYINEQHLIEITTDLSTKVNFNNTTLPSRKVQSQLIKSFYREKYPLLQLIPFDYFSQEFDKNGPLISPFLLLVMFAHASDDDQVADSYFKQALELLDYAMTFPSLSTVVALCLLSLYEPNSDYRFTSRAYGAMAFRMCNGLGYGQLHQTSDIAHEELRKRILWGCYCLDKMQGIYYGDAWMIRLDDINMDLPRCHWPNEDQEEMEGFVAIIKLMQMAERCLKPDHFSKQSVHMDETFAMHLHQELIQWLQALPPHFHWTPLPTLHSTSTPVPTEPPRNSSVAHLHLLFNMIQLRILLPFASPSCSNQLLHQRCISAATNLTQITCSMAEQNNLITSYLLTATGIMLSTRAHLLNCTNQTTNLARHSRFMFQRGMRSLSSMMRRRQRLIPGVDSFVIRVEQALHIADSQVTANDLVGSFLVSTNDTHGTTDTTTTTTTTTTTINNANNHMYLSGSEQNAAEVLSQAFGTSTSSSSPPPPPPSSSTTTTSSSLDWRSHQHNNHSHYQRHHEQPEQLHHSSVPLYFLETSEMDHVWNERMAPSSVDALLYKSRFFMDDQRQQDLTTGGLLMSHAKLNDPSSISNWFMRQTKDRHWEAQTSSTTPSSTTTTSIPSSNTPSQSMMTNISTRTATTTTTTTNDNSVFWPIVSSSETESSSITKKSPVTPTTARSLGHYMNIGLGVYASAHQHHNDVIRQHIPEATGSSSSSRPVILTHQGQVIVTPTDTSMGQIE